MRRLRRLLVDLTQQVPEAPAQLMLRDDPETHLVRDHDRRQPRAPQRGEEKRCLPPDLRAGPFPQEEVGEKGGNAVEQDQAAGCKKAPGNPVRQEKRLLEGLPEAVPAAPVTMDPLRHLLVAGYGGGEEDPLAGGGPFPQLLGESALAGTGAARDEDQLAFSSSPSRGHLHSSARSPGSPALKRAFPSSGTSGDSGTQRLRNLLPSGRAGLQLRGSACFTQASLTRLRVAGKLLHLYCNAVKILGSHGVRSE